MNQLRTDIPPSQVAGQSIDEVDLLEYWNVIWREKWGIAGLVIAVSGLALVVVFNLTPIYSSTATLLIEAKEANVVSIEEVYGIDSSSREYFATQFEILNSRQLAEEVITSLDLKNHPEFDAGKNRLLVDWRSYLPFLPDRKPPTEEQAWQSLVLKFQAQLSVQPIRDTQLVKISFESAHPQLTYAVANALGEAYIDSYLESRLALTQKAADWLTDRLGGMRADLESAERELQAFRERENLVDVSGVATLSANEIDEIQQRLVASQNRVAELKSQHDAVGATSGDYSEKWETLPGVLSDQLTQRLKENEGVARQQLSELSQRYGPKHPRHIAATSKIREAQQVYRRQVRKVVSGFEKAYGQAIADLQQLEQALDRSKSDIQGINRKRYELSQLEREVQASRQLYDMFFTRFKETNIADFEAANARFIDRAVEPFTPVKPQKSVILFLSAFFAGVVGVLLAFLRNLLDNTVKTASEVESKLKQPVIGVLPKLQFESREGKVMSEAVLDSEERAFSEAVRTTRTGIALSGIDKALNRIVITSSVPQEGKTTTAMNIAFAFGKLENVILLDADLRRPSVAGNCGFKPRTPGLSNLIAATDSVSECIHAYKGIDVIPAGVIPPNPLELLSSDRFVELLTRLEAKYDRIIIDSAPTQAVSDSLVLSSHVDGVLYVVRSDFTSTQVAQDGLQRLQRVNANLIGVILNQFDAAAATRYGGYHQGYYDYYGYGSNQGY